MRCFIGYWDRPHIYWLSLCCVTAFYSRIFVGKGVFIKCQKKCVMSDTHFQWVIQTCIGKNGGSVVPLSNFIIDALLKLFSSMRPRQNGRHFTDDIFKCIFLNEKVRFFTKMSMKFVPWDPIDNNPVLVYIMVWRRPGDKPLSEPMMVSLLMHICITQPQWVNLSPPSAAYMRQWIGSALVQIMACRLFSTNPLSKQMLVYCQVDP